MVVDGGKLDPFAGVGSYRKSKREICNDAYGSGPEPQTSAWTHTQVNTDRDGLIIEMRLDLCKTKHTNILSFV